MVLPQFYCHTWPIFPMRERSPRQGAKKFVKLLHFFIALGRFSDKIHFNDPSAHNYLLMTHQTKTPKNPLNSSVSTLFALNFYLPVQLAHYSASWPDTFKNQPTKTRI